MVLDLVRGATFRRQALLLLLTLAVAVETYRDYYLWKRWSIVWLGLVAVMAVSLVTTPWYGRTQWQRVQAVARRTLGVFLVGSAPYVVYFAWRFVNMLFLGAGGD